MKYSILISRTVAVMFACQASAALPCHTEEVFVGLQAGALLEAVGWQTSGWELSGHGMVVRATRDGKSVDFCVGAFANSELAQGVIEQRRNLRSIPPSPAPGGSPIGDEFNWWARNSGYASLDFRRKNIVVAFARESEHSEILSLARAVDDLIRDNRTIAPLGQFAETPAIDISDMPTRFVVPSAASQHVSHIRPLQPAFRGLGDPARLRFGVFAERGAGGTLNLVNREGRASSIGIVVSDPDPAKPAVLRATTTAPAPGDGRFLIDVRYAHRKLGREKFRFVAVNDENVVAIKDVELEFALE